MIFCFLLLRNESADAQCSQWGVSATAQTSTCAANGGITATLTGNGAASLTNILYSLEPLATGGYGVPQSLSPVFGNVPGGSYRVVVQAVCNGVSVSASTEITVSSTYVPMNVSTEEERMAFGTCNTGQGRITFSGGNAPYTITITRKPAEYTGRTAFVTSAATFVLDSLKPGAYTLTVSDACAATAPTQSLTVSAITSLATTDVGLTIEPVPSDCRKLRIKDIGTYLPAFHKYFYEGTPLQMSCTVGGVSTEYLPLMSDPGYLTLPAGTTISDFRGAPLQINFKSPCNEIITATLPLPSTRITPEIENNCSTDFNLRYSLNGANMVCYPLYLSLKNSNNSSYRYDTVAFNKESTLSDTINHLVFGDYEVIITGADGKLVSQYYFSANAPAGESPYFLTAEEGPSASLGKEGIALIAVHKTSLFSAGTRIEVISPADKAFTYIVDYNNSPIAYPLKNGELETFGVGNYLIRVTDNCGAYEIPITIEENDVFRYSWSYTSMQTCTGLSVIPTGHAYYKGQDLPTYYQIVGGPAGSGNPIVPAGSNLLLSIPGAYRVAVSAYEGAAVDFGPNGKDVRFDNPPLAVDVENSLGWVCPRQPDNSGTIKAFARNGSTAQSGAYTFKLAEAGKGATGPYLAVNNTGYFSSAASGNAYSLIANQLYDIRVEDDCGASAVQSLKITDFATAQVVSSDKPQYCLGETVRLRTINLPTTAKRAYWTGPDNFHAQSAVNELLIPDFKAEMAGVYRVAITSDMCSDSIIGTVTIGAAPYLAVCYSAITDTSVNPYVYGLLGSWRPMRSYTYYGSRAESDPDKPTDIRNDGAFASFDAFWQVKDGKWAAQKQQAWVWNAESTIFNAKGFELENKDPLGRYNSGLYGYGDAIPVAVVQNSHYQEAAFEGFEDYFFADAGCQDACPAGRRFDFTPYMSRIDSTQRHTGRYSIRVAPGDTVGVISTVMDTADTLGTPSFNETTFTCNNIPTTVLKSVRADSEVLLPSFALLSGKKVLFSAWVKEVQDCQCSSYESNQVSLAVTLGDGNSVVLKIKPAGAIIDGWQRYEQVIDVPAGSSKFSVVLLATGSTTVFYDDIRIHPYNANMKSFIYDARNLRMMAELDENNYATFFEYDDDATLTRVKKETERGVKTIKETRSALIKE
ncbi:hypothetical protein [Chitinophaga filiformis]|uniref:SprB repeat-containing protein n=1 Tax=Chitinophaga filiformis TaxID=104663 RepID=A0ABY4HUJ6_CHIFI|nr:hypothetical protein [Chitinophaga filiformis]UPK67461.1 hypothetical protein MYF79_21185 [Chitinophaga filiformis]